MGKTKSLYLLIACIVIVGVGIWQGSAAISSFYAYANVHKKAAAITPIQHVVIIMQENHTFDNMFGRFPGVNGYSEGHASNPLRNDFGHGPASAATVIDGGKMDQFPPRSYVQYDQTDIPNYWAYAQQFGLGD